MSLEVAKLVKKIMDELYHFQNDVRIYYWPATDCYHIELEHTGQTRYLESEEEVLYLIKEVLGT